MVGKRLAVRGLETLCRAMWGFPPTIIRLVVDHMGPLRAIGWFGAHMPRFLISRVVLGPVRVHLACIVVSLRNGCGYCAYGHVYALELLYMRQHGRLFPIRIGFILTCQKIRSLALSAVIDEVILAMFGTQTVQHFRIHAGPE